MAKSITYIPDRVVTQVHCQRFSVSYEYPVLFTRGLFEVSNPAFADALAGNEPDRRHRFVVFIDSGVAARWPRLAEDITAYARHHEARLELAAEPETAPGGETIKNDPALVARLQRRLLALGIDRQSYVVAIGGGAVLDAVGYVAATTHRGVRHVRVPTTVLAQNDSGVGVKNGVNAFGIKNFVGAFAPPYAVLNDIEFIDTLEVRDKIAGMAEAVKVGLVRDVEFFLWIEENAAALSRFEPSAMEYLIRRCAELHMAHIAGGGDPFEVGSARPLDYGHWAGHKLETLTAHALRHGEAVAIGMALDARYSVLCGLMPTGQEIRICTLLERLGFRLWHPAMDIRGADGVPVLLDGLEEFREHLGGELSITLLKEIGRGVDVHRIDTGIALRAAEWLRDHEAVQCS